MLNQEHPGLEGTEGKAVLEAACRRGPVSASRQVSRALPILLQMTSGAPPLRLLPAPPPQLEMSPGCYHRRQKRCQGQYVTRQARGSPPHEHVSLRAPMEHVGLVSVRVTETARKAQRLEVDIAHRVMGPSILARSNRGHAWVFDEGRYRGDIRYIRRK